ncbi:LacI family DNA-binding transcriptional regulator [Agromyces arachidis]|uniref:LacI family DNA-binding transcriptional regulator n=1 Tax=Agromyces arachidis TaxID=766966 RepID=UPI004057CB3F
MSEVARLAGVSQSTVSHVLNKTRRIAPETERAVLDALEQTGYVSDRVARSLRTGRTGTIGLAISAISNPYFAEVVHAIEREVTESGFTLLLSDTHDETDRELKVTRDLLAHRPDGVILAPSAHPERTLHLLQRQRVPVVLVDRTTEEVDGIDSVAVENVESMAELVGHVAGLGHRRIAYVSPLAGLTTSTRRLEGYRLGLERAGIEHDPRLEGSFDGVPPEVALGELLAVEPAPTALIAGNNQTLIETMGALQRLGVTVPDDLSLGCFDDFPWAEFFSPRLTAVRQPVDLIGRTAAELLLSRLADVTMAPRSVTLRPTLVVRDSVRRLR